MIVVNGFIVCHTDDGPVLINTRDISYVLNNEIHIKGECDECIIVDESFTEINNKINKLNKEVM